MHSDWIQKVSRRFPPDSWPAALFAVALLGLATLARAAFGLIDVTLLYATYYPAVMCIALIAGPRIAAAATVLSVLIVWFAFVDPPFAFDWPTPSHTANMGMFLLSCGLMIWLAERYRKAMAQLNDNERERNLMMSELEHRGKNTYAVVESIVRSSLEDAPERAEAIANRIRAVSSTNDIINRSPVHRLTLTAILRKEFEPYGVNRLQAHGEPIELSADIARAMGLVVHELVTNAVKYGALSAEAGRVSVAWKVEGRTVDLEWREHGGPPARPPERFGFGSKLVTRTMRALAGSVTPDFRTEGLVCRLVFDAG